MADVRIAVMGAAGRMGQTLVRAIAASPGVVLSGATEQPGSIALGEDPGQLAGVGKRSVKISGDADAVISGCDALLDFTAPNASVAFAKLAAKHRKVHIIGTTGCTAEHDKAIAASAKTATIVKAGNMSLGVNLLLALTRKVAAALDEDFDIEIVEMHHRMKVDAPSGTALMLGQAAAEGRGIDLDQHSERGRDGLTGARERGAIGFSALRGGNVVGEHTVIFAGEHERIEITHKATDRALFARGAVKAALWGVGKPPGLYSMTDVLGL
ncbi:MAG: 4-hydroxy-tetrahydrodipicolinate reductase [Hyphomicrobiaceae bacterium]